MPCFPSSKARVVEPEPVVHKNVHRYGETNIRHLDTRPREHWQKGNKYQGRQLPATPIVEVEVEPHELRRQPESRTYMETQRSAGIQQNGYETPRSLRSQRTARSDRPPSYRAPAPPGEEVLRQRPPRPKTADFFVSVPIFNETLNHSYRKKNTYVYRDSRKDQDALYHASLARASSVRSLDRTDSRPHSGRVNSYRQTRGQRRPQSADRYYEERRYDDRHNRSDDRLVQTLPSDFYSKPLKREERQRHNDMEYRRPRSADRQRSDRSRRNRRQYENPDEYYRSKARYVDRQDENYRPVYMNEKPRSQRRSNGKRRQRAYSEFSYDSRLSARSYSSVYSYESERLTGAVRLRKAPSSIGISIDSDNEDRR